MCVDIGRCRITAVSHPLLYVLHVNAVLEQQGGACVAQIMEPNHPEPMFLQKASEMSGYIIGAVGYAEIVDIDVIRLLIAVPA